MRPEQAFGMVIRKRRKELEISQEELAYLCDLDRTFISLLERGQRKPTLNTIWTLAKSLQMHPHVLVQEVEQIINEDTTG